MCPECSDKLNYKSKKREVKRLKKAEKKRKKAKHKEKVKADDDSGDESPRTPESAPPEEPTTSQEAVEAEAADDSLWKKGESLSSFTVYNCNVCSLFWVGSKLRNSQY